MEIISFLLVSFVTLFFYISYTNFFNYKLSKIKTSYYDIEKDRKYEEFILKGENTRKDIIVDEMYDYKTKYLVLKIISYFVRLLIPLIALIILFISSLFSYSLNGKLNIELYLLVTYILLLFISIIILLIVNSIYHNNRNYKLIETRIKDLVYKDNNSYCKVFLNKGIYNISLTNEEFDRLFKGQYVYVYKRKNEYKIYLNNHIEDF